MLLDRLLDQLGLHVQPFAICRVRRGWRLQMAEVGEVHLHFVVSGRGRILAADGFSETIVAYSLVVVPPHLGHRIEPDEATAIDLNVRDAICQPAPTGLDEIFAGDGPEGLVMTCGRLTATFGGTVGLFDHLREPLVHGFDGVPEVKRLFERLLEEQTSSAPGAARMTQTLMEQCLIHLFRAVGEERSGRLPWLGALEHPGFARVLDAILEDPSAPHTLDSLAATSGMSRSVFSERFRAAFGRSAVDLVREARLRRAARLLQSTDLPVKQIAHRVGFSSRSHFSKAFKESFGRDPAGFRGEE